LGNGGISYLEQVVFDFQERPTCDREEPQKIAGGLTTETLGNVGRNRGGRPPQLIAEAELVAARQPVSYPVTLPSKLHRELPTIEVAERPHSRPATIVTHAGHTCNRASARQRRVFSPFALHVLSSSRRVVITSRRHHVASSSRPVVITSIRHHVRS
jgi:hypothetical protein